MTTTRTKSLLVGTLSGVLCLLAASQSAFAAPAELDREDIVRSEQRAIQDALEGEARGYRCETVQAQDGSWEAQCALTESEAD